MNKKHKPYVYRLTQTKSFHLRWTRGFGGLYYLYDKSVSYDYIPKSFYYGERWIYVTPGLDTYFDGGWRGNESDNWICYDLRTDMKAAIDWLHESEESRERTLYLWTTNPDFEY